MVEDSDLIIIFLREHTVSWWWCRWSAPQQRSPHCAPRRDTRTRPATSTSSHLHAHAPLAASTVGACPVTCTVRLHYRTGPRPARVPRMGTSALASCPCSPTPGPLLVGVGEVDNTEGGFNGDGSEGGGRYACVEGEVVAGCRRPCWQRPPPRRAPPPAPCGRQGQAHQCALPAAAAGWSSLAHAAAAAGVELACVRPRATAAATGWRPPSRATLPRCRCHPSSRTRSTHGRGEAAHGTDVPCGCRLGAARAAAAVSVDAGRDREEQRGEKKK
jgi:hypothetical protein